MTVPIEKRIAVKCIIESRKHSGVGKWRYQNLFKQNCYAWNEIVVILPNFRLEFVSKTNPVLNKWDTKARSPLQGI